MLWNCYFLIKLLFEFVTFSELLLIKDPYFFKSVSTKATFSEDAVFRTTNFQLLTSFSVTLSIYHLVTSSTNTRAFRLKLSEVHRVVHQPEYLYIKYHEKQFCIKFSFSGQHWTGLSIKKYKKISFGGVLLYKNINFVNIEFQYWIKIKNLQFMTCHSSLQFIPLEMTINTFLKWKISITVITLL